MKVILLRVYLAVLGATQKAYLAAGGPRTRTTPPTRT
jgi:hypothetical protein